MTAIHHVVGAFPSLGFQSLGECIPTCLRFDVDTGGAISHATAKPYAVNWANSAMGSGVNAVNEAGLDLTSCMPCEPVCLALELKEQNATGAWTKPYKVNWSSLKLSNVATTAIQAEFVLHPFCCDWANTPTISHGDRVEATGYIEPEGVYVGLTEFEIGDFQLDSCSCVGVRPIWRSGIGFGGQACHTLKVSKVIPNYWSQVTLHTQADTQLSAYQVRLAKGLSKLGSRAAIQITPLQWVSLVARGLLASVTNIQPIRVTWLIAVTQTKASAFVDAYVVQWVNASQQQNIKTSFYPIESNPSLHRLRIPQYGSRSYIGTNSLQVKACEQVVIALNDGRAVNDIVEAWLACESDVATVGYTRELLTIRDAQAGEWLKINVLRETGQVAELKIKVV